jgi:ATP-binding cassette subfamily F protein 3
MSLLAASLLSKSYGAQDVLTGITVTIPHQARIALVGSNGVGKTTLLRLLIGLETPDSGSIQRARGLRIGYLPQEVGYSRSRKVELDNTLWEFSLEAFDEIRKQEAEIARLEAAMADPQLAEDAITRYGELQETFERAGGYTYPVRIRQVLRGLGFTPNEYRRPIAKLSGGERTRALLAKLLLEDPDLLVLDEPTNHLDIESVEWLEGWLRDWPGGVIVVSHDRYFLDNTVDVIWELSALGLELFRGNYSAYFKQREERRQHTLVRYRAQQDHIRREQTFIQRNIAGQKTRQAQGRRKRLERLLRDGAITQPQTEREVQIELGNVDRSGDHVIETHDLIIGYPDAPEPLFQVPDLVLRRGECVALIGPNGAGKTTFLKTLLDEVKPWDGTVRLGASLKIGYFAQAHEGLDVGRTVLEEILAVDPSLKLSQARDFLARFQFRGDMVDKRIDRLSGGERGRVALAKLALEGANLLLLDEPTNHLDIPSQEVLQEALISYPGTILLVSHDRYLIDALATQVWAVASRERELDMHAGGYGSYLEARKVRREAERVVRKPKQRGAEQKRKISPAELEAVEERIAILEAALAQVGIELQEASDDFERARHLGKRYAEIEEEIAAQMALWERLARESSLA